MIFISVNRNEWAQRSSKQRFWFQSFYTNTHKKKKHETNIEQHLNEFPFYDFNFRIFIFQNWVYGCSDFNLKKYIQYSLRTKIPSWNNQATKKSCVFFDSLILSALSIQHGIHLSSSSAHSPFLFNYAWRKPNQQTQTAPRAYSQYVSMSYKYA